MRIHTRKNSKSVFQKIGLYRTAVWAVDAKNLLRVFVCQKEQSVLADVVHFVEHVPRQPEDIVVQAVSKGVLVRHEHETLQRKQICEEMLVRASMRKHN